MELGQAIKDIIRINEHVSEFWGDGGWAPPDAANMLSKSRLDWHVSLSRTLFKWCEVPQQDEHDGCLILAWANLGALVEGTMKWFLSVFYDDYSRSPVANKGRMKEPDELSFWKLTEFFSMTVWTEDQRERWKPFADRVREKRNAIHAYQDRDIGDFDELQKAIITYRSFLLDLEGRVSYPDEQYGYPADIYEMQMREQ